MESSFISKIFYLWFDRMTWKGYRKPLEKNDLWSINPEDTSKEVTALFNKHWQKSVANVSGTQS